MNREQIERWQFYLSLASLGVAITFVYLNFEKRKLS